MQWRDWLSTRNRICLTKLKSHLSSPFAFENLKETDKTDYAEKSTIKPGRNAATEGQWKTPCLHHSA
jgi:hypothetical protein